MAEYRVSGVWKNAAGQVEVYAVHTLLSGSISKASGKTKQQLNELLEIKGNKVKTWIWNYALAKFENGERVFLVTENGKKSLKSNLVDDSTNDLGHLINLGWFIGSK